MYYSTLRWLDKCDTLVNLTDEQIHPPAILISKVSIRGRLMETGVIEA